MELDEWLGTQARLVGLDPETVETADLATLRAFCERVLSELAARGHLPAAAGQAPGCHARPRSERN